MGHLRREMRDLPLFPLLPFGPLLLFGGVLTLQAFVLARLRKLAHSVNALSSTRVGV